MCDLRWVITCAHDRQEIYLTGVTEYSGSVRAILSHTISFQADSQQQIFRACVSGKNSTFADGLPLDFTTPVFGTLVTQTMGWNHTDILTLLGLLPGTIIAVLTIYLVVKAVGEHEEVPHDHWFDPSDAGQLVAAAAGGGLRNVFEGAEARDIQTAERVSIFLDALPGQRPAFRTTGSL